MGDKSQKQGEKESKPRINAAQRAEQTPVGELPAPAEAFQRAKNAPPAALRPSDFRSLQKSVGNRVVQRIMQSPKGTVQRCDLEERLPQISGWKGRFAGHMQTLAGTLTSVAESSASVGEAHQTETGHIDTARTQWGEASGIWNEGVDMLHSSGGGGGGGEGGGSGGGAG